MSDGQEAQIRAAAEASGDTLSAYIRQRLFPENSLAGVDVASEITRRLERIERIFDELAEQNPQFLGGKWEEG